MPERTEFTGKPDQPRRSNKPFGVWVSEETLLGAGFNYSEPSTGIIHENRYCRVYISDQEEGIYPHPNIVVIEDSRQQGAVRWREFYFSTFAGKPVGQRRGEEVEEYIQQMEGVLKPENQVSGEELEGLIDQFVPKYEQTTN